MSSGKRGRRRRSKGTEQRGRPSEYCRSRIQFRPILTHSSAPQRPSFAFQVDQAVRASITTPSDLEASASYQEDSDKWLEVSPEEVDAMLAARSGGPSASAQGGGDPEGKAGDERGEALSELAKKVEDFVGGQGDIDGARFAE